MIVGTFDGPVRVSVLLYMTRGCINLPSMFAIMQVRKTDESWTASPGLQKVRFNAKEAPCLRKRCVYAPVFVRIKSSQAHTS